MNATLHPSFLKIVSLNIELDRHLDRILPFLKKEQPDVILMQEVLAKDISIFEETLGMKSIFTGLKLLLHEGTVHEEKLVTFSALPIVKSYSAYYRGDGQHLPLIQEGEAANMDRAILVVEVIKNNKQYCLVNTHFTWTPDGQPSEQQHQDLEALFQLLAPLPPFILCGDFNAPRGGPIFDAIGSRYKDNIPSDVTTTIDKNLHSAGDLQLVVDGVFSTPQYHIESVKLFDNLSDHWAIVTKVK